MGETGGPPRKAGAGLAARFRRALTGQDEAQARLAAEEERAKREGQAARAALFVDLEAFAAAVGRIEVRAAPDGLTFGFGGRRVAFRVDGEYDRVRIERDGPSDVELALFRQPELDHRWVYVRRRRNREDRVPLFDAGLEDLLVNVLGLPPPAAEGDPSVALAPAAERKL